MGEIVVSQFVTVDGVMEDPGGSEGMERGGWAFQFNRGEDGDKFKLDEVMESSALLLGRKTYEGFAAAWPSMEDPVGFADKMNGMPKYVVSSTLENPEWNNSTVLRGDLGQEVAKLKQDIEGVILVGGSAQLVRSLVELDLVDEFRLMVFPVILGTGKRLFGETSDKHKLRLADSKTVGDGIEILTLERVPA